MSENIIEIMAPAGDWASYHAAIQGGADSVYFGVGRLNMRARSTNNFTLEDLPAMAAHAKDAGVKTYLTLNTVLYDEDLPTMRLFIDKAKESGITAIIAADPAAILYARQKGVAVHISTQSNITNIEMVEFYSQYADVMVMARELNLNQVAGITASIMEKKITGPGGELVRIELFAHGALCMAISGKCYLSLHSSNSSANRGACKQPCRQMYKARAENGEELLIDHEYIMSPKDLCTVDFLDQIVASGVGVLKIEGRGRSPEYVKTVTRVYREASDAILNQTYTMERAREWKAELNQVYNRGFWDGYYLGKTMGEWSAVRGSASTRVKVFCGKVLHYYPKAKIAHIRVRSGVIQLNDELIIIGQNSGVIETKVTSIRVDETEAAAAQKGTDCTIPVSSRVRKGDSVYVWAEREQPLAVPVR